MDGHRLAVDLPVRVEQLFGVVSHRLRQAVLDVFVGVAHLLDVLGFKLLRGRLLSLTMHVSIETLNSVQLKQTSKERDGLFRKSNQTLPIPPLWLS